jgi:beta-glucosidase/6-phospho-beta-glucosidase/beta-galactosidase
MAAIVEGELRIPGRSPVVVDDMAGSLDMIGLNHDHPIGVDSTGAIRPYPASARRSDAGFTPVPNEVAELVSHVSSVIADRPMVIAAHGVPTPDDEWREQILKETVPLLVAARDDGVDLVGYLHDTAVDAYEGPYGFASQRGLLTRGREVKDSAAWLAGQLEGGRER